MQSQCSTLSRSGNSNDNWVNAFHMQIPKMSLYSCPAVWVKFWSGFGVIESWWWESCRLVKPERDAKIVDNTKNARIAQAALHKLPGKSRIRFDNCVTRGPPLYFIRSWVALSFKVVCQSGIGNTCPDLHFLQYIKAWMYTTDPVSSITNCYRPIVSCTDPVHSFIIS